MQKYATLIWLLRHPRGRFQVSGKCHNASHSLIFPRRIPPSWHSAHPKAVGIPTASGAKYPGSKWGKVRKFNLKIIQVLFGKHTIGICGYVCPVLTDKHLPFPRNCEKSIRSISLQVFTSRQSHTSSEVSKKMALTFIEHPDTSVLVGSLGTPGWHHFGLVRCLAVKIKTAGLGPPQRKGAPFQTKNRVIHFSAFERNHHIFALWISMSVAKQLQHLREPALHSEVIYAWTYAKYQTLRAKTQRTFKSLFGKIKLLISYLISEIRTT